MNDKQRTILSLCDSELVEKGQWRSSAGKGPRCSSTTWVLSPVPMGKVICSGVRHCCSEKGHRDNMTNQRFTGQLECTMCKKQQERHCLTHDSLHFPPGPIRDKRTFWHISCLHTDELGERWEWTPSKVALCFPHSCYGMSPCTCPCTSIHRNRQVQGKCSGKFYCSCLVTEMHIEHEVSEKA